MIIPEDYDHTMWSLLEEGKLGQWSLIKTFAHTGEETICWKEDEGTYRDKYAADYPKVVLASDSTIWMMDTPFEQQTAAPAIRGARGDCLVAGLGIGMVPSFFARKVEVDSVHVVELNRDVIGLVGGQLLSPKNLEAYPWLRKIYVSQGDFWTFVQYCDEHYDTIQVDIWPTALTAIQNCDKATIMANRLLNPGGRVYCWMAEHGELIKESMLEQEHPAGASLSVQ